MILLACGGIRGSAFFLEVKGVLVKSEKCFSEK
jgi:hypothetical protein